MRLKVLLAVGILVVAVIAAGPGSSPGLRAAPVRGGTLVISHFNEVDRLDPQLAVTSSNIPILYQLYDTLFRYDLSFRLHPHLVREYRRVDPTTYRFELRTGVRFHNGRELTAEDVRFSLLRAKDPKVIRRFADNIADVRVISRSAVEVKLEKPDLLALHWLSTLPTAIVPREEVERAGDAFGTKPVGTGPFKLVEFVRDAQVTLEANPGYFLGRPLLDRVVMRVIPDPTTMLLELESGRIDIAYEITPDSYARVGRNPDLEIAGVPVLEAHFLAFNVGGTRQRFRRDSPFNDARVRQAVYHGVRWDEVFRAVIPHFRFGERIYCHASVLAPIKSDTCKGYWPTPSHDPERARRLLREAGYRDESRPSILVWNKPHERAAIIIQADLRQVGMNVEVDAVELQAWNDRVLRGDMDAFMVRWGGVGMADPYGWIYRMFHSSQFDFRGNVVRYVNPEVDQLLDQAAAEEGPQRLTRFQQAQRRVIQDVPSIPVYGNNVVMAWNKKVKGFRPDPLRDWAGAFYRLWVPSQGVQVYVDR